MNRNLALKTLLGALVMMLGLGLWLATLPSHIQAAPAAPTAETFIYNDALAGGWENWSWGGNYNLNNASPVLSNTTASIAATITEAWGGFYIHTNSPVSTAGYQYLRFWIHGGTTSGQRINVSLESDTKIVLTLTANTWTKVEIPLTSLGSPSVIGDITWQDNQGNSQATFYLDAVSLVGNGVLPPPQVLTLTVNAQANRHPINPYIYGMSYTDETLAADLNLPARRWGGNATTRYNWQNDTSNRASDWYFENIPSDNPNFTNPPNGSEADLFVEQDRRTGTATLLTVPLIGWTPKSREISCAYSVAKYGAQQSTDPWRSDCGNGVYANGSLITTNDPQDTSLAITPSFVQSWINHLKERYGNAANGGVKFYSLDNEPMLWNSTHRDVHPSPTSYDELRDRTYTYGAAVKAADPTAATTGPVLWGWTAYFYSALDQAPGGEWWNNPQDRNAHGGTPFVAWYLQQMRAYEQQHGVRILDYLDLHFYPQNGAFTDDAGPVSTQALRLRSTRALWDPTYLDESWINDYVNLIPRMKAWVSDNYTGTKLALTEYNWGAHGHINGAVTQADLLGIFGREGLDAAFLWGPPTSDQPGAYAFRMYLNYDGADHAFGETGIQSVSSDQEKVAVYAAERAADNTLTMMVVNKSFADQVAQLTISGFTPAASASVYRYSSANLQSIQHLSNLPINGNVISTTYPASSITLLVVSTARPYTNHLYLPIVTRNR